MSTKSDAGSGRLLFIACAVIVGGFSIGTIAFPDTARQILEQLREWVLEHFSWLLALTPNICLLTLLCLSVSPLGSLRLGGATAKPEFSRLSWFSMLYAAGVGVGYMFFSAAEPLAFYTDWAGAPFDTLPGSPYSKRLAISAALFHWGLHAWAIYAVAGLAIAVFGFRYNLPLTARAAVYPLLGERTKGHAGDVIDGLAVIFQ